MIEKEEWLSRHKNDEKEWEAFKQYCLNCGFKSDKQNGQEVIFAAWHQEDPSYQKDCYFFTEEQDMGAHIPCCNKKNIPDCYEPKNCDKTKCKKYISRSYVDEIVNEIVGE